MTLYWSCTGDGWSILLPYFINTKRIKLIQAFTLSFCWCLFSLEEWSLRDSLQHLTQVSWATCFIKKRVKIEKSLPVLLKITTCILTFPIREKSTATADLSHKNLSPRFIKTKSTSIGKINKLRFPLLKHPIISLQNLKTIFSLFNILRSSKNFFKENQRNIGRQAG